MDEHGLLAERFEEHRRHLRGVAFRMLGSVHEADDAVQEAWLRLSRADTSDVANLRGWLTTATGRVCLDVLRTRASRREEPLDWYVPDPIVSRLGSVVDPEQEALLAESVGIALYVVLETLAPAERLAFVLHDMFGVPFEEIGTLLGRSANAAKQLASRARRRVQGSAVPNVDLGRQYAAVDAFFAAARSGEFDALVALLDSNVTLRSDAGLLRQGTASVLIRGAAEVARRALMFALPARRVHRALVNGAAGVVVTVDNQPVSVMGFTVADGRIVGIDALIDPDRLSQLDLSAFVAA